MNRSLAPGIKSDYLRDRSLLKANLVSNEVTDVIGRVRKDHQDPAIYLDISHLALSSEIEDMVVSIEWVDGSLRLARWRKIVLRRKYLPCDYQMRVASSN